MRFLIKALREGEVFWLTPNRLGPDDRVRVDSAGDARLGGQGLPLPAELAGAAIQRAEIYNTGTSWVAYARVTERGISSRWCRRVVSSIHLSAMAMIL